MSSAESIAALVASSRRELLDLGLRNPLLNHRTFRARGLEIVDERSVELHRILCVERRSMQFRHAPDKTDPGLGQPSEPDPHRHVDRFLQTPYSSAVLQHRLLHSWRLARTLIEEQGVNVLFLALGMLHWRDAGSPSVVRRAPLVLVPVLLDRSSARARFSLAFSGEELGPNLSLAAKLEADHGLELPEADLDDEDVDLATYFAAVARCVEGQPEWRVEPDDVALGFFSFGRFLMYRDLDDQVWPADRQPVDHPVLGPLLGGGFSSTGSRDDDSQPLDDLRDPDTTIEIADADDSQIAALVEADAGANLVIQGPPGTGKSQTIANLIAQSVARGRRVLFVAEKMAALEVVKRRFTRMGLGELCLELHSHKTRKRDVLDELARTLEIGRPVVTTTDRAARSAADSRRRLSAYRDAIAHPIGESELDPQRAIATLVALPSHDGAPPLVGAQAPGWSPLDFERHQALIEELEAKLVDLGPPTEHPFFGAEITAVVRSTRVEIEDLVRASTGALEALQDVSERLGRALHLSVPRTPRELTELIAIAALLEDAPDLYGINTDSDEWTTRRPEVEALLQMGEALVARKAAHAEHLLPEAWHGDLLGSTQQLLASRKDLQTYGHKWWRFFSLKHRRALSALASLCRKDAPSTVESQIELLDTILDVRRMQRELTESNRLAQRVFGSQWKSWGSDWVQLRRVFPWMIHVRDEVDRGRLPPALLATLAAGWSRASVSDLAAEAQAAFERHAHTCDQLAAALVWRSDDFGGLATATFAVHRERLARWSVNTNRLRYLAGYNHVAGQCKAANLVEAVRAAETWSEAPRSLSQAFARSYYEALVEHAMETRPELLQFDRARHEHVIERFCKQDRDLFTRGREVLASRHFAGLPARDSAGQMRVLRRELEKKRRHLPIRKLLTACGDVIQDTKPVFMMSPMSVARYLAPEAVEFDLVVFDEASQVRPVDAFGAILRGKQVVVVGDSKQLPPTSFFERLNDGDDQGDDDDLSRTADLESILGLFVSAQAPSRMLRWHYRSRHPSLIAVSNAELYDGGLVLFPSPHAKGDAEGLGLHLTHLPHTAYERGGTRTNPLEAEAVAQAALHHARETPHLTLGVAAFSSSQAAAIVEALERLRREDAACEPFFSAHPHEPFFIKNLENVQGDERDTILISVGYGKAADGSLTLGFGPLNLEGGERRLNVLITRARRRCEVFTNLSPEDIDLSRTRSKGVAALRTFLEHARDRHLDQAATLHRRTQAPDPLETRLAEALRAAGHQVEPCVGSSGLFVDVAVKDPDDPARFLLGVMTDGASYQQGRTTRGRDRLQPDVLRGLGWRLHRLWSPELYRGFDDEIQRTVDAIEATRRGPMELLSPGKEQAPVRRDASATRPHADHAPPYEVARLDLDCDAAEPSQVDARELATWIAKVTAVEGPIHVKEASYRLCKALFGAASRNGWSKKLGQALELGEREDLFTRREAFLWDASMGAPQVRDRRDLRRGARRIERIAPEELQACLLYVVGATRGLSREKIMRHALKRLGVPVTELAGAGRGVMEQALDALLDEGRVVSDGEALELANPKR